jgi:hypothetical protein
MKHVTRRLFLKALPAGVASPASSSLLALSAKTSATKSRVPENPSRPGGLCLNEDNSHYFFTRAGKKLDAETVSSWVDQYAGTQVRELILNVNCMRTSYASQVWDPIWRGYDPAAGDDQPLLASTPIESRQGARNWIHTAWQLHRDGIDIYDCWIRRARQQGLSPWISVRMNDVHNVNDERSFIHSEFWRQNPLYRRVPYRSSEWTDRAFDYGRLEVREHHMKLIRELAERYDFDGLELDWMRFGFHFKPGHEGRGAEILTEFTGEVRRLLDSWEKKRGHRIRLGARVPSRPQTALGLGYDVATWARRKWIDLLVVTPFWASAETDMPIELWRKLLNGTSVLIAAGLEVLLRAYPESKQFQTNSLETVRGAAASLLDRGADRVYLFNYMDSQTAMDDLQNYPALLREVVRSETLTGKSRRHVLTFADTWAPGEPRAISLPVECTAGKWRAFRLATGPIPAAGTVVAHIGIEDASERMVKDSDFRVNGEACQPIGSVNLEKPKPDSPVFGFEVPRAVLNRGYNLLEISPKSNCRIVWVEIAMKS